MSDRELSEAFQREAGWDAHDEAQSRRLGLLPFSEKLAWLEEAQRVVNHFRRQENQAEAAHPPAQQ